MTQAPFPGHENTPPSDETFEQRQSRTKQGGVWKYLLIGCLGIIVVGIIIAAIGSFVVYKNWRGWSANFVTDTSKKLINSSQLPGDQKTRMISSIEKVGKDFKDGKLTLEQVGKIAERIASSPMMSMGMVYFFEQQYVSPSGLSAEEKTDARRTMERLARGVFEKSITQHEMSTLTAPLMEKGADGKNKLKKTITDTELRDFLANANKQVETAKIPDEPFKVDMANELDKVIAEVQSGKSLPATGNEVDQSDVENQTPTLPATSE